MILHPKSIDITLQSTAITSNSRKNILPLPIYDTSNAYIEVLNAFESLLHLIEFVVVSSKKCACSCLWLLVKILDNGPRNAYSIIGRCASSQLIELDKRTWRHVIENVCSLCHLYHKGWFAHRYVVACTYTGEDFVYNTNACTMCRHETSDLSQ